MIKKTVIMNLSSTSSNYDSGHDDNGDDDVTAAADILLLPSISSSLMIKKMLMIIHAILCLKITFLGGHSIGVNFGVCERLLPSLQIVTGT